MLVWNFDSIVQSALLILHSVQMNISKRKSYLEASFSWLVLVTGEQLAKSEDCKVRQLGGTWFPPGVGTKRIAATPQRCVSCLREIQ